MADERDTLLTGDSKKARQIAEFIEFVRQNERDDETFGTTANRRFMSIFVDPSHLMLQWKRGREFSLRDMFFGQGHGWKSFPELRATPPLFRLRSRKPVHKLGDFWFYQDPDWFFASARAARAMAQIAPGWVDVLPVEVELRDGTLLPAGTFNMVDVTRKLPAYDLEASGLTIERDEYRSRYLPPDYRRLILREDLPADAHLFRDEVDWKRLWLSVEGRDALIRTGVTGLRYAWADRFVGRGGKF